MGIKALLESSNQMSDKVELKKCQYCKKRFLEESNTYESCQVIHKGILNQILNAKYKFGDLIFYKYSECGCEVTDGPCKSEREFEKHHKPKVIWEFIQEGIAVDFEHFCHYGLHNEQM